MPKKDSNSKIHIKKDSKINIKKIKKDSKINIKNNKNLNQYL